MQLGEFLAPWLEFALECQATLIGGAQLLAEFVEPAAGLPQLLLGGGALAEPAFEPCAHSAVVKSGELFTGGRDVGLESRGIGRRDLGRVRDIALALPIGRQRELDLLPRGLERALLVTRRPQHLIRLFVARACGLDRLLARRQLAIEQLEAAVGVVACRTQFLFVGLDFRELPLDLSAAMPDALDQFTQPHGLDLHAMQDAADALDLAPARGQLLLRLAQRALGTRQRRGTFLDDQSLGADFLVEVLDLEAPREQTRLLVVGGEEAHAVTRYEVARGDHELPPDRKLVTRRHRRGEIGRDEDVRQPVVAGRPPARRRDPVRDRTVARSRACARPRA